MFLRPLRMTDRWCPSQRRSARVPLDRTSKHPGQIDGLDAVASNVEIVDLAVEDDSVAATGALHRLAPGGKEVEAREPGVDQIDALQIDSESPRDAVILTFPR